MSFDLLFPNFEILIRTPEDVARLNEAILQLAVQGKLVPQDPADEPASELLKRIRAEKRRLVKEGKLREEKPLPLIKPDEMLYGSPRGWVWTRFGTVTLNRDGERVPLSKEIRENRRGPFDYYGASGVIDKIDDYLFDKPLLLIGEDGANLINRSTPIAFIACGKYWVNNHAHVLDSLDESMLEYLRVHVNAIDLTPYVTGTAQPKMNQAKMNSIPVAIPPLAEQRRIVAKVESLFAQTRALEAKLRQAQADIVTVNRAALHRLTVAADDDAFAAAWATMRDAFDLLYNDPRNVTELRQAILQLAVQGKLVPQDPADEPAGELLKRIRAEKRRLVKEGKISGEEFKEIDADTVPHVPIGLVCDVKGGIQKSNDRQPNQNPRRYITVAHVQRGRIDTDDPRYFEVSDDELERWRLVPGDILVVEGNGSADHIGRAAIFMGEIEDCVHQNHVIHVRPNSIFVISKYLNLYLNSPLGREHILERSRTTSGLYNLSVGRIKTLEIPLPSLAEQHRIVAKVDQLMRQCDALEAGLARAEGTRRAVTAAVVLGGATGGDASLASRRSAP